MQRAQGLQAVLCAVSEARQIWKVPACPASEPGGHLCDSRTQERMWMLSA